MHNPRQNQPLDPLADFSRPQAGSILKPILMITVVVLLGSLIPDYTEEISYYFQSNTPVELGHIDEYPSRRVKEPNFSPPLKHNTYVHLRGIPLRRGQSRQKIYYQLAGDDIFVEAPREKQSEVEQLSERRSAMENADTIDRSYVDVYGRLLNFEKLPGRYNGIRRYYRDTYAETFCETLSQEGIERRKKQRRDAIISQWKEEYAVMTPEQKAKSHMKPLPSEEEIHTLEAASPICIHAYLVQQGKSPSTHIWYLVGLVVIILFILLNVVFFIRWVILFFRS